MFTFPRLLSRLCCSQNSGRRFLLLTPPKIARFRNKEIADQFKNAVDSKMEAKKFYQQQGVELRPARHLLRALAFFAGTGLVTFSCSSIIEYYNARKKLALLIEQTYALFRQINFGQGFQPPHMDNAVAAIIALNVMVYILWRIPQIQPFMIRYFANGIATKSLCLPMLLGVFSHNYFFHLFINMYVLSTFATGTVGFLGREQFVSFYLTGGVFASLLSLVYKCITRSPLPSLGASGAIAAMIGYVCTMIPEARLSIIFLPWWTFSAQDAIRGMIAFEVALLFVGYFTRFKVFDNAAHLGGLLFGMWYANHGEEFYRRKFMPTIVHYWLQTGLAPKDQRPVMVFDGKKHMRTTMDRVETGDFKADEREAIAQQRRHEWDLYREHQLQKQRERKQRILERRNQHNLFDHIEEEQEQQDGE